MRMALSKEDALLRILQISRSVQAKTQRPDSEIPAIPATVASLIFPPTPNILPELQAFSLAKHTVADLVAIFHRKCAQLQSLHNKMLLEMQSHCPPTAHNSLYICLHHMYSDQVTQLQGDLLRSAQSHCDRIKSPGNPSQSTHRTTFNQDYVPVLEQYFKYNAYPSTADRALMARKSMMTQRQIEVWFQNHRSRARKEGKHLPRLRPNDPLPNNLSFEVLGEKMGDLMLPEGQHSTSANSDESDAESYKSIDEMYTQTTVSTPVEFVSHALNPAASSLAFPSVYVPSPLSFLSLTTQLPPLRFTYPPLRWPRQPSTNLHRPRSPSLTDHRLSELVDLFARLTVRDGPEKRCRRRAQFCHSKHPCLGTTPSPCASEDAKAATRAITTILCNRRHPAFVVSPITPGLATATSTCLPVTPSAIKTRLSSIHDPPRRHAPFPPPSASAQNFLSPPTSKLSDEHLPPTPTPSTLRPSPSPSLMSHKRRKISQLPRRVPASLPITHRSVHGSVYHPYTASYRPPSSSSISLSSATSDSDTSDSETDKSLSASQSTLSMSSIPECIRSAGHESSEPPSSVNRFDGLLLPASYFPQIAFPDIPILTS